MRTIVRVLVWIIVVVVILTASAFTYLRTADLSDYEEQFEEFLSDAIGHKLVIDGLLKIRFGGTTQLTAEEIRLSNPEWQPEPVIVSIGYLSVTIDLWSLLDGPIIIEDLDVRDVSVRLERNSESQTNWDSAKPTDDREQRGEFDPELIAFKDIVVQEFRLTFADPARRRPINATIDRLTVNLDENNILALDLRGMINEIPLSADGKLGSWENLLNGEGISTDLDLTFGQALIAIEGSVDNLAQLAGTELSLSVSGPAIDRVTDRLGLPPFAAGGFQIDGRILKLGEGSQFKLEGNLGAIEIFASGTADNLLKLAKAQLEYRLSGPDTKHVAEVFGIVGAPTVPFLISGSLGKEDSRFTFSGTRAQLGDNDLAFDGWLDFKGSIPNGDLRVSASGQDFSVVGPFAGIQDLPTEAFEIGGRIQKSGSSWRFDEVEAVVGENRIWANGAIGERGSPDTQITFRASGPDFSMLRPMTGLHGIQSRAYEISAVVKPDKAGIRIENAKGIFGDIEIEIDGTVGTAKGLTGTDLRINAGGSDLRHVALLAGSPYLPDGPFTVGARARINGNELHLTEGTATVSGINAIVSGTVSLGADAGAFDLDLAVNGPDLAQVATFDWLGRLSGEPFWLQGRLEHRAGKYELHSVRASISDFEIDVDGNYVIAEASGDILLRAYAPDAQELRKLIGIAYLPDGAVSVSGRIEKHEADLEFTDVLASIGEYSLAADGKFSTAPLSNSSDLEFSASGPELRGIGMMFDYDELPARPFSVSGEINGIPTGFVVEHLVAKIDDNNIDGGFTVDLSDKPEITGRISSSFLDLRQRLARQDAEIKETEALTSGLLLSDKPLDTAWLDAANIDITVKTDRLILGHGDVRDFHLGIRLQDRVLNIDPVSFRGSEGRMSGKMRLAPENDVYEFDVSLSVENMHVGLLASKDQERATVPAVGGQFEFSGSGKSLHEIMASSHGKLSLTQGKGRIKDLITSQLFGDLILQIIRTLNPLQTAQEYTTLQCGIYVVNLKGGLATIENLAIQTDRMAFVARGNVNFEDEKLNLTMSATPREGLGISIGGVANSLLKLGGTLRSPKLMIDPAASITTTGAAVATGGLSIVAKGLWDRVKAQSDICGDRKQ